MCKLDEQKHTKQAGGRGSALFLAPVLGRLSASVLALAMAPLVAIAFMEPVRCQSSTPPQVSTSSQVSVSAPVVHTKPAKARQSKHRRRAANPSTATSAARQLKGSGPETRLTALTPHIDQSGQKADAEVTAVLKYGARKHNEGNYEEAEAAFRHVLCRDPANVDAFYDLGALAERKGDLIGALSSYRAALALKPHDKEIAEAVSSIEKTLRNRPAFSFRENHRQANRGQFGLPGVSSAVPASANAPVQFPAAAPAAAPAQFPAIAGDSSIGFDGAPVLSAPVLNSAVMPGSAAEQPPLIASPQLGALPVDPVTVAPGTFQLSSAKNGLLAPTMGVTPGSTALPAAPPVVGVAPRSHPVARMFLNTALNQGASIGLRAAGLHCPACHLMRFRF
ncbi:MAG: hypothetical protein C0508_16415 [Cyanobacteria bacterium PR.023]|nr:hypothetical protein [Cyanobacteria bacterium PR.023]